MIKKLIIILTLLFITSPCFAAYKYNPHTRQWENVPDNWNIRYDVYNNNWSYQPQNAQIMYNPYSQRWEWNSGHNRENCNRNNLWYRR